MSFLDKESQGVVALELQVIADHLLNEWINSNLDEGVLYSDYQIALMCDSNYLKGRYNQFYNLTPEDEYYVEWDEEA